ncbi:MAG: Spy/CpxP family protein refolding chaperone [Alphaproteobacteria bacterium]|nr:Spy/CpxP family protein refolding chaperone [Alphaproteobacteria bacterium]
MKRMLLVGTIAASAAIVVPVYAQTPAVNPNPPPTPAPMNASEQPGGGGPGMPGGPMMHREMWRHGEMRWNPEQRCIDRLARRAAHRAYVETELNLTPEQRPLWGKLQNIAQGEQQRERQLCQQLKPDEELTTLQRLDRAQQFLSARLDALQAAKPAVQALYQSLSPEQREIFDHPFHHD